MADVEVVHHLGLTVGDGYWPTFLRDVADLVERYDGKDARDLTHDEAAEVWGKMQMAANLMNTWQTAIERALREKGLALRGEWRG